MVVVMMMMASASASVAHCVLMVVAWLFFPLGKVANEPKDEDDGYYCANNDAGNFAAAET